jgi:dTDP-4-dehydrorhamnose reductase
LRDRRILIFGANGFLARNLIKELILAGYSSIVGITNSSPSTLEFNSNSKLNFINVNYLKDNELRSVIISIKPDLVINCAALTGHETCEIDSEFAQRINRDLPGKIALSAKEFGFKFIHFSTDAIFSGKSGNYEETSTPKPFSVYGRTKLEGEDLILKFDDSALIFRINFFGWSPSGDKSILEFFLFNLISKNKVNGFTDYKVSSIYVDELSRNVIKSLEKNLNGIFHLGSSDSKSKFEFGNLVADTFELDKRLISPLTAEYGEQKASRARDLSLNSTKLASALNLMQMQSQLSGVIEARTRLSATLEFFNIPKTEWRYDVNS